MAALFGTIPCSELQTSEVQWVAACLPNTDEDGNLVPFSVLGHVKVDHDADNLLDALGLKESLIDEVTERMFPKKLIEHLKEGGDFTTTPSQDLERLTQNVTPDEILVLITIAYMDMRRKLESAQIQHKIMDRLKKGLEDLRDDLERKEGK